VPPDLKKWFAPIMSYSKDGKYIMQQRADLSRKKEYPRKIPAFFSDLKYSNFGWIDDQLVCIDYGCVNIVYNMTERMKKIEWKDG